MASIAASSRSHAPAAAAASSHASSTAAALSTPAASISPASTSTPSPSILLILGCTGVGKTKLSVELAERLGGEVLSADSIQIYAGLPIASNQLSIEEARGVVHHGLAVLPPHRAMHVHHFRRAARRLIAQIHQKGKPVVLVGGTFYWMESILFKTFMNSGDDAEEQHQQQHKEPAASDAEQMHDEQPASSTEAPFSMPADSPLTIQQLQSLTPDAISELTLDQLAFACSCLLVRLPANDASTASAVPALLRHLSSNLSASQFQQLLAAMPKEDVRSVRFVSAILGPTAGDSATASAAAASAGSSSVAAPAAATAFPPPHLLELLSIVDPHTANRLHPNDGRKLQRALAIFLEQRGRATMSELIAASGGKHGGGQGLQYRVQGVWLDVLPEVLDARLDARVDVMVARGLVKEVETMYLNLWRRQQRLALKGTAAEEEEQWRYENPLDPNCEVCATVESRDISLQLPAAAGVAVDSAVSAASAASSAASASPSSNASPYLGPTELLFDWERGLGQALGFKEFRPYFRLKFHTQPGAAAAAATATSAEAADSSSNKRRKAAGGGVATLDPLAAHEASLARCLADCVQSLKDSTRQYARKQNRWIRTRLWNVPSVNAAPAVDPAASASAPSSPPPPLLSILRLDSSRAAESAAAWNELISAPALAVCQQFLAGDDAVDLRPYAHLVANLPAIATPATDAASAAASSSSHLWVKRRCDSCEALCTGPVEWEKHLRSKRHQRSVGSAAREEKKKQQMERQEEVRRLREAKKTAAAASAASASQAAASTSSDSMQH